MLKKPAQLHLYQLQPTGNLNSYILTLAGLQLCPISTRI